MAGSYPWHTQIVATSFWVGEQFDPTAADGSQVCSAYDGEWAYHWSGGVSTGASNNTAGCNGAPLGGCDGAPGYSTDLGENVSCWTQVRTAQNGFFPTDPAVHPAENPFYVDLPFDDLNNATAFAERCAVIPWAKQVDPTGAHCTQGNTSDTPFSYMKNAWVRIVGPNGQTCYGQVEDAGPGGYHDAAYVFGTTDARPANRKYQGAGMDVSPALTGCLGFDGLDNTDNHVNWQFVDRQAVPAGPWTRIITTSGVRP